MMKRMAVGAIISLALAYGVLSLFGFYRDNVTPLQIAIGLVLAGIYMIVFRAGATKREREALHGQAQMRRKLEQIKVGDVRTERALPKVRWDEDTVKPSAMKNITTR